MAQKRLNLLPLMKEHENEQQAFWSRLARDINAELMRFAGPDGIIPKAQTETVINVVNPIIIGKFLTRTGEGDLRPYQVVSGRVMATSPYFEILWKYITAGVRLAVQNQADIMEKMLAKAPDVKLMLMAGQNNPIVYARSRVQQQYKFRPNPLANYDPAHLFVNNDGTPYRLSDRIWRTTAETRRRIDTMLEQGIATGRGALDMADDLEQFLIPKRLKKRTIKPYGKRFMPEGGASFDAMRLARTEITAAAGRAGMAAANLNPFVEGYSVRLSGSHPKTDICDIVAAEGPYPLNDMEHLPPLHPHCLCAILWELVSAEQRDQIIGDVRENISTEYRNLAAVVGPMLVDRLTDMLLSEALPQLFPLQQVPLL